MFISSNFEDSALKNPKQRPKENPPQTSPFLFKKATALILQCFFLISLFRGFGSVC